MIYWCPDVAKLIYFHSSIQDQIENLYGCVKDKKRQNNILYLFQVKSFHWYVASTGQFAN